MCRKLKSNNKSLSYNAKKAIYGYAFIAIWLIGFISFFIRPLITTASYSLNNITFLKDGLTLSFNHFSVYKKAILEDPQLLREMISTFTKLIYTVPLIVVLSIMVAVMLNDKFHGKTFFRAVFFIPVIVSSGLVLGIIRGDSISTLMVNGTKAGSMLQVTDLKTILNQFNLPTELSNFLMQMSNEIFNLLWKSGIQILLFLSGLQTVNPSIYEASMVEGASKWDNFWKITIPMLSPMIVLAVIYSIIDSFTSNDNVIMSKILSNASMLKYTEASVISVMYFTLAMVFIAIIYFALNKFLPYSNAER